jgi:hypothetical protein
VILPQHSGCQPVGRLALALLPERLTAQINELTTELTALISVRHQRAHRDPRVRGADRGKEDPGGTAGMGRFRSKDAYAQRNGTAPQARTSAARADDRRGRRGAGGSPIV